MPIYAKVADDGGKWVEIGADGGGGGGSAWGDFTTNGDETTSNTWGPDGQGRMWKWAEWNAANDYSVNLTGGLYWVLTVGGGDAGWAAANQDAQQGQPGTINEGYWEFPTGATSITVGSKSLNANSTTDFGMPSSIGNYGTQGIQSFGHALIGRGGTAFPDPTGYTSTITGTSQEYATGYDGTNRPGRGGRNSTADNRDGCVIIATAAPNAKALNWVHTTYHAEVSDGVVTAVHTQKHYADGTTTPLPFSDLIDATYGVSEGWLFVNGELQPPPSPPAPTRDELIADLEARIKELRKA